MSWQNPLQGKGKGKENLESLAPLVKLEPELSSLELQCIHVQKISEPPITKCAKAKPGRILKFKHTIYGPPKTPRDDKARYNS